MPGGSGSPGDPAATPPSGTSEPVGREAERAGLKLSAEEYYEELDIALARRAGGALWALASAYTAAVLATRAIVPAIGWLVALAVVSVALATRLRGARDRPPAVN